MKNVTIIGVGMGNTDTLTIEGKNHIDKAEVLLGAKRMIESVNTGNKPSFPSFDGNEIKNFIQSSNYVNYAVLMSGDTGFYSGTTSLLPLLKEYEVKVIPGISTVSYFCSKLKLSWEDAFLLSLHGREENIVQAVRQHMKTFALTDGKINAICQKLTRAGLGFVQVYVGENLSYDKERIVKGTAEEIQHMDFAP